MEDIDDDIAQHGKIEARSDRIVCQKLLLNFICLFSSRKYYFNTISRVITVVLFILIISKKFRRFSVDKLQHF